MKLKFLSWCCAALVSFAQAESVVVYAEKYFAADWGVAPVVQEAFAKNYPQCELEILPFDGSSAMLNRVRLEGEGIRADVVVGLDNFQLESALQSKAFVPHGVDLSVLSLPIAWESAVFVPYDFGEFAFVYDTKRLQNPPSSLREVLTREDLSVIYQDPRTSSVGRGLVAWLNLVFPEDEVEGLWRALDSHTVTVTKGWSEAYGAFLKGEADLVLSYNTSPIYHLVSGEDQALAAVVVNEPVLLQVETAAKTVRGENNACANDFIGFLLSPEVQRALSLKNVMLPVIDVEVNQWYDDLKKAQLSRKTLDSSKVSVDDLRNWVSAWQEALLK